MLNFTAIDFETANSYRGSPCSVGLVKVRAGTIVDERHWLIRPPEPVDWFEPFNVSLHGISPEMVADAPRWEIALPGILDFIGGDIVVAHNAGFDIGVIRYACAVDNIPWPDLRFLCTLVLARHTLRLPSYRPRHRRQHHRHRHPPRHRRTAIHPQHRARQDLLAKHPKSPGPMAPRLTDETPVATHVRHMSRLITRWS